MRRLGLLSRGLAALLLIIGLAVPAAAQTIVARYNAGGGALAGTPQWQADTGSVVNTGNFATTSATIDMTHASLPAGTPMALFQSERWDPSGAPEMTWAIPAAAGQYEVRLYFAETYSGAFAVGARVFSVAIEGQAVLTNYDVYKEVGANKGVMKSFTVTSDGTLNIAFTHVTENPMVNGVEIVALSGNTPQISATPSSVAFGSVATGQSGQQTVAIKNTGTVNVTLGASSISGANAGEFSAGSLSGTVLTPNQTANLAVTFAPSSAGGKAATVTLAYGSGQSLAIPLSGTGGAGQGGALSASATSLSFGNTTTPMQITKNVTVTNTGGSTVTIQGASLGGTDAAQFSFSGIAGGNTIAAGQSKTVAVAFKPTSEGAKAATLSISHSGSNSPLQIALAGFGQTMDAMYNVAQINSGGSLYTGTDPVWSGDTGFNTGSTASTGTAINTTDPSVPPTVPQIVWQTERWDPADAPELTYTIPVGSAGKYTVRLLFAETYSGAFSVGARVFDVSINGQLALDNYDVFAKVGANKAVNEQFVVDATNQIAVSFAHVTENPALKGIMVFKLSDGQTPAGAITASPSPLTFGSITVGQTSQKTLTLTNTGGTAVTLGAASLTGTNANQFSVPSLTSTVLQPNQSVQATVTFAPTSTGDKTASLSVAHNGSNSPTIVSLTGTGTTSGGQTIVYRVKAGTADTSTTPVWATDAAYVNTGNLSNSGATIDLTHPSVPAGTPMSVFQTERWDPAGAPNMAYAFPVTPGQYQVRLYFAETYWGAMSVGARVFSVGIEGQTVLPNYDIYAEVGGNKGVVKTFTVASDGTLNIAFTPVTIEPQIRAIEILSGSGTPVGSLSANPSSLAFGSVNTGSSVSKTVVLTNNGTAALQVNSSSITGTDAAQFADGFADGSNVTLQPSQTLTLTATFSPTSTGSKAATLNVTHTGSNSPLTIALSGTGGTVGTTPVSFGKSQLSGTNNLYQPTTLQWGPDGKLYVGEQNGLIRVYTISRNAANSYAVTATETINLIANIPNHNDDGSLAPSVTGRLLTGILVVGTAQAPIIYAGSTDPRIGAGSSGWDTGLDTNSGILSKLTKSGNAWSKVDLVRGLPRSEENHAPNGLVINPATNKLYLTYGGNTNNGAPSNNFALLPEYALNTAILEFDLTALGNSTYDLPTLNSSHDNTDPFGGDDGFNQAKAVANGPVKVYARGFRNNYDIVLHSNGKLYTVDNGANAGWGGPPINCTNQQSEPGPTTPDSLHWVTEGYYGGHPNPTRGNKANTWNGQTPVEIAADSRECTFIPRDGAGTNVMTVFNTSTNGLAEYTASNFGGQLAGELLTVGFDNVAWRIKLNGSGTSVTQKLTLFSNVGNTPLDITAQPDSGNFPGTIWVADYGLSKIVAFEPADYGGASNPCNASFDNNDADGDGYTNADEMSAGTDPCSAADVPADWDGDKVSNKTDSDDDNDGLPDTSDLFAIDAANGKGTSLPITYTWDNDAPKPGKLLNTGFTGVMTNKTSNYEALFNAAKTTSGGAAGVFTVDEVSAGDAWSYQNNQEYGFQLGVNVSTASPKFVAHTRLLAPFAGLTPQGWQSMGLQIGTGDQENYIKLVVTAAGGTTPGVQMGKEEGGNFAQIGLPAESWSGVESVDLYLTVDPAALSVVGEYAVKKGGVLGAKKSAGTTSIPAGWLSNATSGLAAGLLSTSAGGSTFPATWDIFEVVPANQVTALAKP